MCLLQKSKWPRAPGGKKLQPVPYPIYRSRIATNIARSLSIGTHLRNMVQSVLLY